MGKENEDMNHDEIMKSWNHENEKFAMSLCVLEKIRKNRSNLPEFVKVSFLFVNSRQWKNYPSLRDFLMIFVRKVSSVQCFDTTVVLKGVVPSIFSRRVRTLESLRDTLLFTRTKTVQYFSKYEPFFWLCLKIDFPLLPTSLEKPHLPTDVTTITEAHYLLRRDKNSTTILAWWFKETHSYCQQ